MFPTDNFTSLEIPIHAALLHQPVCGPPAAYAKSSPAQLLLSPVVHHVYREHLSYKNILILLSIILLARTIIRYIIESVEHRRFLSKPHLTTTPPAYPAWSSLLGSTVLFLATPKKLLFSATTYGGNQRPAHIKLAAGSVYIVQGRESILNLWKASAKSSSTALHTFTFRKWFAMPEKTIARYAADNSGFGPKPHPTSNVAPHNRADRLSHLVFKESLTGPDSGSICGRFANRFCQRLTELDVNREWNDMRDLVEFFQLHMTAANTESLWGIHLTKNSSFCADFWAFNSQLQYFSWNLPRWMIPKAYARRTRLLNAMKQWQNHGTERQTDPWDEKDYDVQYWGSTLMRKWQKTFLKMDDADQDGLASVNLTFSWAVNSNVVPSAFWVVLEIFRRPALLAEVRSRLPAVNSITEFLDLFSQPEKRAKLCTDPLLQSIFAETLRLRVHVYTARRFIHDVVELDGWKIPQDKLCLVSSHPAHMHGDAWNTDGGKHPLEEFWPYRFLVPVTKPSGSSTVAFSEKAKATEIESPQVSDSTEMAFSLEGLDGIFIPFGGGPRGCPGQKLAKHHMIVAMAAMAILFDVDILADEKALQMDETKYGAGTLHPVGKVPFRIRRRIL